MSDLPRTSKGKIARLSAQLREAVNRRIHDGETAPVVCAWLNALPEVRTMLAVQFEGEPVQPQNISNWRMGGFQKWLKEQARLDRSRARCLFSRQMVEASGGNMAEGVLASLTGDLAEILEEIDDLREAGAEIDPKLLASAGKVLVAIRGKEIESRRLTLDERAADQRDRALALDEAQFELRYVAKFIEHAGNKRAHEIATGNGSKEVKMEQLREILFGRKPEGSTDTPVRSGDLSA